MADFLPQNSITHPLIRAVDDYNNLLDHGLEKPYSYLIRKNGSYYEAIKGGSSTGAGTIAFGGASNAGATSGTDFEAVYTAADAASGDGDKIVFSGNDTFVGDVTVTQRLTLEGSNMVGPTIQGTVTVNSDYVTIRDLIIYPNSLAVNGLVLGTDANYCYVENVRISTAQYGLYKASANTEGICNTFVHLDIRACTKGIYIEYADGSVRFNSNAFYRCTIAGNVEDGAVFCDGGSLLLSACDIENNGHHGLDFQSFRCVLIDNCWFEHNAQSDGATYSEIHGITNAAGGAYFCNLITIDTCNFTASTYAENTINFENRVSNWEIRNCNIINTGRTYSLKTHSSCTYGIIGLTNQVKENSLGTTVGVIQLNQLANQVSSRGMAALGVANGDTITHGLGVAPTCILLTQKRSPIISAGVLALDPTVSTFDTTTFTINYYKLTPATATIAAIEAADQREVYWEAYYEV